MDSTVNVQSDTKKDHNMIGDMIEHKKRHYQTAKERKKIKLGFRISLIAYERCFKLHCDRNCLIFDRTQF